ncbi:MAG: SDR family oxidoreductase [Acidimicrobiia bacterium]
MSGLDGKVALVTGAGQGIGQGISYALAAEGAAVSVVGRTAVKLKATVDEIIRRGGTAIAVVCDVKDGDQVRAAVDQTVRALGGLDVLVNNAQEYNFGSIIDIPLDSVEAGWKSGPLATLLFMREAFPHLHDGGVIVNVSSPAAVGSDLAGVGAYSAAKAAIESLSRAAAVEWAGFGIRVNTIMPIARTPAIEASFEMVPGLEEQLTASLPLRRLGDPERDIGPAVVFVAGPGGSYMTGSTLSVDGGAVRLR